jgi:hypothetical protein
VVFEAEWCADPAEYCTVPESAAETGREQTGPGNGDKKANEVIRGTHNSHGTDFETKMAISCRRLKISLPLLTLVQQASNLDLSELAQNDDAKTMAKASVELHKLAASSVSEAEADLDPAEARPGLAGGITIPDPTGATAMHVMQSSYGSTFCRVTKGSNEAKVLPTGLAIPKNSQSLS